MPSNHEDREKRLLEFQDWFACFSEYLETVFDTKIEYSADATEIINDAYWIVVDGWIRSNLRDGEDAIIDRHKIISVIEICIMHNLPIIHANKKTRTVLNAKLAFYIGKNILTSWGKVNIFPELSTFEREHETWLNKVDQEGHPYFSNAATWYLYEECCVMHEKVSAISSPN